MKKIFSKTVRLAGSRHNYIVFFLLETRELAVYLLLGFLALFLFARALRSLRERERGSCLALVGIATRRGEFKKKRELFERQFFTFFNFPVLDEKERASEKKKK